MQYSTLRSDFSLVIIYNNRLRSLSVICFCKPKLLMCVRLHVDLYYFEEPSCAQ